jgi:3-hydroxymyristoyl/3-hydroxydecanoyl-(acyl carrier protein) dehydratase
MSLSIERAVIDTAAPVFAPDTIRTLVHKRFPENVLLTGIRACAEDHFVCTGRIPTAHPLFNEAGRTPREDILFYTEVGRQASLAVTHAYLNVGLDDVFIFERSEAAITDAIWRLPSTADTVEIAITVKDAVRRKNAVTRVIAEHSMTVGGEHVFTGTGRWTIQSAAIFKRLRRGSAEASAPDAAQPRAAAVSNRVIAPLESNEHGAIGSSLVVDVTHPFFFDHACDHVPGMLLLEGFAQLALGVCASSGAASPRMAVMAYDADFTQFVECTLPTSLTARLSSDSTGEGAASTTEIVVGQRDVVAGTARVRVGFPV